MKRKYCTKSNQRYQAVSLPMAFVGIVRDHVIRHPEYNSIADFVAESVRNQIRIDNGYLCRKEP